MILRHLPQRDRHITAQARLRSEQIIEAVVTAPFRDIEADRKQFPRWIEQIGEIHGCQCLALRGQVFQFEQPLAGVGAGLSHATQQFG